MSRVETTLEQNKKIATKRHDTENIALKSEELFEIFTDWERRATLASKKLYVTVSAILAAAFVLQLDYSQLSFWGLRGDDEAGRLTLIFFLTLLFSGISYWWNRSIDMDVRDWKLAGIRQKISRMNRVIEEINTIAPHAHVKDIYDISFVADKAPQEALKTVRLRNETTLAYSFWLNRCQKRDKSFWTIENAAKTVIHGLAFLGAMGIVLYWLWSN